MFNVGVIGYGRSGRDIHIDAILKKPEQYRVAAVADRLPARREMAKGELGVNTYENYQDMLNGEDLDIVINASFSHEHFPITLDLLQRGFAVVSDKPFTRTPGEADELTEASLEGTARLFPFQQSRFAPYYEKAFGIANSGILGRINKISICFGGFSRRWDWQTMSEFNAGNLRNTGPHALDQALTFFAGDTVPEVFSYLGKVTSAGTGEDYAKVILTAKGHPMVEVEITASSAYPAATYNIDGANGSYQGTMKEAKWKYFKTGDAPEITLITEPLADADGNPAFCSETLPWIEESCVFEGDLFDIINSAFYDRLHNTLANGADFPIKLWQVRRQMEIIEKAYKNSMNQFKI